MALPPVGAGGRRVSVGAVEGHLGGAQPFAFGGKEEPPDVALPRGSHTDRSDMRRGSSVCADGNLPSWLGSRGRAGCFLMRPKIVPAETSSYPVGGKPVQQQLYHAGACGSPLIRREQHDCRDNAGLQNLQQPVRVRLLIGGSINGRIHKLQPIRWVCRFMNAMDQLVNGGELTVLHIPNVAERNEQKENPAGNSSC